ncbi:MAG: hypothetical protein LUF87_00745 [Alistipes sp.]|nr:hypothetical protein [Alistipes sp.]
MKNNYRFMFVAALAAMAAFGCAKDNDGADTGEEKKVRMTIDGYTLPGASRAESSAVTTGSPVTFNGGYIYFTSATEMVVKTVEITATGSSTGYDPTTEKVDIADLAGGVDITNVPAGAVGGDVYILGNVSSSAATLGTVNLIKSFSTTVEAQYDSSDGGVDNVYLYGVGSLTASAGSAEYETSIDIAAVGARLEIGEISVDPADLGIAEFRVDGIFINNFYATMGIAGEADNATDLVDNGDDGDDYTPSTGVYASYTDGILYDYNATSGIGTGTADVTASESVKPSGTNEVWAYNLLAPTTITGGGDPEAPRVIFRISDITAKPGYTLLEGSDWFLTMNLVFTGADQYMKPGYVYTISNVQFEYSDLEEEPEMGETTIEITATLMTWTVEGLTYNFGN